MADLRRVFRPEFLNRPDEIIVFRQLEQPEIRSIARRMLRNVGERLGGLGISFTAEEAALDLLAQKGFDPDYGARPLRRAIRTLVEDPAAEALLSGTLQSGDTLRLTVQAGALALEPCRPRPGTAPDGPSEPKAGPFLDSPSETEL